MSSPATRSLRILLVEDHGDTSSLLRTALERKGHVVTTTSSVSETLTVFSAVEPDVLISDIGLPDGSGWDLLPQIHDAPPFLAIATSGFGSQEDRRRSLAVGFQAHLIKPFRTSDLYQLLEHAARAGNVAGVGSA